MDIFIEKNMLLDMIIQQNEYILSTFNSISISKIIETIMELRENLNQNDDKILLNKLIDEINYFIIENIDYIQEINQEIENLQDSIIDINQFINKLNSTDSLSELMGEITIN
jgi:uncharacterized coiled-coil DUF342 family protein